MKLTSFTSLGKIDFSDPIDRLVEKFKTHRITRGSKQGLESSQASLNIDNDIYIVFNDELGSNVEYIEVRKGKVIFLHFDLLHTEYNTLKNYFIEHDENLIISIDSIRSPKFGIEISVKLVDNSYSDFPEIITVFNKKHLSKEAPSVDDIINHFLKKN